MKPFQAVQQWLTQWRKWSPSVSKTEAPIFSEFQIVELAEELSLMPQRLTENERLSTAFKKGEQPSPFRGSGFEYEESRLYQAGDEVRHINWRLMGRTGQAYSKLFQEERQQSLMILLDMRQSMRFGTQQQLKVTQGMRVAGYYAWYAQQQGLPVTAVALAEQVDISPIFEGKNSYAEVMHHLSRPCPPQNAVEEPTLESVLHALQAHFQPGMRLIVISDFIDLNDAALWLLSSLQNSLQVKLVHLLDPAELKLPAITGVQLQGLSGGTALPLTDLANRYPQWSAHYFQQKLDAYQQANLTVKWLQTTDDLTRLGKIGCDEPMEQADTIQAPVTAIPCWLAKHLQQAGATHG